MYLFIHLDADLLYKDYQTDLKFTVTTYTANGVVGVFSFLFLFKFYAILFVLCLNRLFFFFFFLALSFLRCCALAF